MLPVGFEPAIPAGERSQTYALDCVATGTGTVGITDILYERVTLLLVAWNRVCWRAFVKPVKKCKVDIELVKPGSTAMFYTPLLQRGVIVMTLPNRLVWW
jgi:hypothetical protein